MEANTRKVRLQNGRVIAVPADSTDADIDRMVMEAEAEIEASRPPRPMDQRIGPDSAEESFDGYRPRLVDDYVGEDFGRSVDAAVMGMGEQIQSFGRGIQNLNPFQTDEQEAELDRQALAAEQFAADGYGTSNPVATAAGEVLTTAPTWLLPGGLPAQMAYAGIEGGIDHSSGDNAILDSALSGATAGVFGKAFDMVGRMLGNSAEAGLDAVRGRTPQVPGQTNDETRRLLQVAKDEGVNLTPAQRTRQRRMAQDEARMSSQPSGQKIHDIWEEQQAQINQMVADRFGIDNASQLTPDVMNKIDEAVSKAYKEAEEGLTRTVGDDQFLSEAADIATMKGLKKGQKVYLDDVAMQIAEGVDGKDLVQIRKDLQRLKKNAQVSNGDYADALHLMVENVDDLIERTAPTGVGARFADARDMARVQKALERTSGVIGNDGNINPRSFDTALGNIYKREYKRGHGAANEGTQRVFDAARLGNFLSDGTPNSGTATREYRSPLDRAIDKTWGEANVDFYLNNPRLYGTFDPMAALPTKIANVAGREAAMDDEDLRGLLEAD